MTVYYTGIGSRQTPAERERVIAIVACKCARAGMVLRSGAAPGADAMFERHATAAGGACEIWLPWRGFQGHTSTLTPAPEAYEIAASVHPAWSRCSDGAKKLHARNVHQILGADLATPSATVVCWTLGGAFVGGTATALSLAQRHGIPIANLADASLCQAWAA